jgi:putative ABC transport system permease protein
LPLLTPAGWRSFPIAGIYTDYGSTSGTIRMSLDVYRAIWIDDQLNGLVLFLSPEEKENVDALTADLRSRLKDFPTVQVNPSGVLREEALVVFDRTFAIAGILLTESRQVSIVNLLDRDLVRAGLCR